jgi:YD repeat-containing protein
MTHDSCAVAATYERRARGGRVLSLDTGWAHERYAYGVGAGGFVRSVTVTDGEAGAESRELRRYTFIEPLTSDGRRWTWQKTEEELGSVTARVFDERTFQPVVVTRGDQVETFEYDEMGLVVRRERDGEVTTLTRTPEGRVATVVRRDGSGVPVEEVRYGYDARGNLLDATSGGSTAQLEYDARNRIATLAVSKGQESTRITVGYDERDRVARIEVVGVGAVEVSYDENGNIARAGEPSERRAALAAASAFGELRDLFRIAEVSAE